MTYANLDRKLADGHLVVLDGGTGTELERRGVPMDADAWCGAIALEHRETLEAVHRDYITAGRDHHREFVRDLAIDALCSGVGGPVRNDQSSECAGCAPRAGGSWKRKCSCQRFRLTHGSWRRRSVPSDPHRKTSEAELRVGLGAIAQLLVAECCDLI